MELKFLGTGSAFATEHFQSNLVLENNGKTLLIDAGGTVHLALRATNIPLDALDAVYITHRHADAWGRR
jgi:ribonuclease BN (tRNA processing enzyme)